MSKFFNSWKVPVFVLAVDVTATLAAVIIFQILLHFGLKIMRNSASSILAHVVTQQEGGEER